MDKEINLKIEFALLGLLALLWGSSYLFLKIAVSEIPPFTLIAIRVSGAALFLSSIMILRQDHLPRDSKTWRMLLVQSFFNAIGAWTLLAWGQQYVDASLASVLNSTSPLFVFLFTVLVTRHEAMNRMKLAGALIGIAGVFMIVGVDALEEVGRNVVGQLACLVSAALYGCAAIYGKRFRHISPAATATGSMVWAVVFIIPLALLIDAPWHLSPSVKAVMAALFLAFFSTGVALLIYFRLVRTLGSLGVASQAYLRAGLGVVLAVVVLDEQLTPVLTVGLIAAITGVALINWPLKRKHQREAP